MSLNSSLENLRLYFDAFSNSSVTDKAQCDLGKKRENYMKKKIEWESIKDVILDLACNAELGFLSSKEVGLYEKLASAYAETLLPTSKNEGSPCTTYALDHSQVLLFYSRLEDNLQKKLEGLRIRDGDPTNLKNLLLDRDDVLMNLAHSQESFTETVSRVCTLTSELFREVRSNAQAKTNLLVASVLTTEAEGLKAQATGLNQSVIEAAKKNETMVTRLRQTRESLLTTSLELEKEIESMERLLRTYQNNDEEYHELVRRYGECQRQLTLRIDLLQNSRNSNVSGTPSGNSRFRTRRSFSAESLPIMETNSYYFH